MSDSSQIKQGYHSKWAWFHRFGSPEYLYGFSGRWSSRFGFIALICFSIGLYTGLVVAPPDYQMGDSYRIMFVHVPSAWMSMFLYAVMALNSAILLIWRIKTCDAIARACAPLGAAFTFCALVTGSLWGKPTWGTYWEWDARMTSELLLLFLYLGHMALVSSIDDRKLASKAGAILAIVGIINLPIIHFSVDWWNTLHQGSSITKFGKPSIHGSMLTPLLVMFVAFNLYSLSVLFARVRTELLIQERRTRWVREMVS